MDRAQPGKSHAESRTRHRVFRQRGTENAVRAEPFHQTPRGAEYGLGVIDIKTTSGPSDLNCGIYLAAPWVFASVSPSVQVSVPDDFAVADVFEVGATAPVSKFTNWNVPASGAATAFSQPGPPATGLQDLRDAWGLPPQSSGPGRPSWSPLPSIKRRSRD